MKANQIRCGTAICLEKTELLAMSREDLKSYLGDKPLEELIFQNVVKWAFRRSEIFNRGLFFDESRLVSLGEFVFKEDNEVIC